MITDWGQDFLMIEFIYKCIILLLIHDNFSETTGARILKNCMEDIFKT